MSRPADQPIGATPILPVPDLAAAMTFYPLPGFEVTAFDVGLAWVHHGAAELLHLRLVAGLDGAANRSA